jgi:prefoldin subunit 5
MNAKDRKEATALVERLRKLMSDLDEIKPEVETLAEEEQSKFDNMTEGLQQGERGQRISENADNLSTASSSLESAYSEIESAIDGLESAVAE